MAKPLSWTPEQLSRIRSAVNVMALGFFLLGVLSLIDTSWILLFPALLGSYGAVKLSAVFAEILGEYGPSENARPSLENIPELAVKKTQLPRSAPVIAPPEPLAPAGPSWMETVDWEEWVGKKLLQKIGILIVLIGMIVFLKYSFDNGWIGVLGRIAMSTAAAAVLLGLGEWFHVHYARWSHAFSGAGLALLYFTVWAARVFYHDALLQTYGLEIPASMAMILYSLITAAGVLAAVRYRAQTIAWFAVLGGYLTPVLIASPQANPIGLSIYLVILAGGLLALAWFARWRYLALAAFLLTQLYLHAIVFTAGSDLLSVGQQAVIAVGFFLLFGIHPFLEQFRLKLPASPDGLFVTVANGVAVYAGLIDVLGGWRSSAAAPLLLALAAVYVAYSALALTRRSDDDLLVNTYLVTAVILVALALLEQLTFDWVAVGWAPYSAFLVFLSVKLQRTGPWRCAVILLLLALVALFLKLPFAPNQIWHPFTSVWALQSYVVFGSLAAWIFLTPRLPKSLLTGEAERRIKEALHIGVAIILFLAFTFESTGLDFTVDLPWTAAVLVFAAVSVVLFSFLRVWVWFAAASLSQILAFLFVFVVGNGSPMIPSLLTGGRTGVFLLHPWGGLAFFGLLITMGMVLVARKRMADVPNARTALIAAALGQVWIHVSVEIEHFTSRWSSVTVSRSLSAWWILFALALLVVSQKKRDVLLRRAAIVLLFIPFLKDLWVITTGDPRSVVELIAWSVLSLGIATFGARAKLADLLKVGVLLLGLLGAADMVLHFGGSSVLFRSIWWAFIALSAIVSGFAVQEKLLRRSGMVLFGVLVLKLLIFDFAALETPVRIAASIGTGLLMIGASYLYQRFDVLLTSRR